MNARLTRPTPAELHALADRCEAASGPCTQLDIDIEIVIGGYTLGRVPKDYDGKNDGDLWLPAGGLPPHFTYPPKGAISPFYHVRKVAFTASLDVAMLLLPPHTGWRLWVPSGGQQEPPRVTVWGDHRSYAPHDTEAATPALALTAAALRARASLMETVSHD